jgi:outer membrane biosynthesis protein TonB
MRLKLPSLALVCLTTAIVLAGIMPIESAEEKPKNSAAGGAVQSPASDGKVAAEDTKRRDRKKEDEKKPNKAEQSKPSSDGKPKPDAGKDAAKNENKRREAKKDEKSDQDKKKSEPKKAGLFGKFIKSFIRFTILL